MAEILVGLTNNKTSFWDPNTRTYLTLAEKTKKVVFNENDPEIGTHLERICHGLFASNPAIKLYEGQIPTAAMDHWKSKFNLSGLNIAKNRADRLHAESATVVTQKVSEPKMVELEAKAEIKAEEPVEKATEEVKPAAKNTRRKQTAETEEK